MLSTKDFNNHFLPHNPKMTINSPDTVVNKLVQSSSIVKFKDNTVLTVHNITQLCELKATLLQPNKEPLANTAQGENRELEKLNEDLLSHLACSPSTRTHFLPTPTNWTSATYM